MKHLGDITKINGAEIPVAEEDRLPSGDCDRVG